MHFRLEFDRTFRNIYQDLTCNKLLLILIISGSFLDVSHTLLCFLSGELNKAHESADQAIILDFINPVSFSVTFLSYQL